MTIYLSFVRIKETYIKWSAWMSKKVWLKIKSHRHYSVSVFDYVILGRYSFSACIFACLPCTSMFRDMFRTFLVMYKKVTIH